MQTHTHTICFRLNRPDFNSPLPLLLGKQNNKILNRLQTRFLLHPRHGMTTGVNVCVWGGEVDLTGHCDETEWITAIRQATKQAIQGALLGQLVSQPPAPA